MKIEICPLEKVEFDGKAITLGMDRAQVEAILGEGKPMVKRWYYLDSEVGVDYDDQDKVDFVEFLGGMEGELDPVIYGVSAFHTDADQLAQLLREHNGSHVDEPEEGYCLTYLDISVGVYRDIRPEDVDQMVETLEATGGAKEHQDTIALERKRAHHWATIGFGPKDYYRR